MKFSEHLWKHLTPEWHSQYIPYDEMKEILYGWIEKAQQLPDVNDILLREQLFLHADEEFFQYCEKEASKINRFFAEKLAEAVRRFEPLERELKYIEENRRHIYSISSKIFPIDDLEANDAINKNTKKKDFKNIKSSKSMIKIRNKRNNGDYHRKLKDLKLAFSEFYLMLVLLKNYQTLNYTGFTKILKKHDKLFQTNRGNEWRKAHIDSCQFHQSKSVDKLMSEVERTYIDKLESGDRTRAMQRLRVPPLEEKQEQTVTFRLGLFMGMICILFPMLIIFGYALRKSQTGKDLLWEPALDLYRPTFLICIHICLVGINIYGWSHSGVNHVLIFEFDPRNHLTYEKVLEIGTFLLTLWLISFLIFVVSYYFEFYPFVHPLILTIILIIFLINPTRTLYYKSRYWFLKKLLKVFLSPLYPVDFASFWLGDQLVSLELIFFDIESFVCFYLHHLNWNKSNNERGFLCSGWSLFVFQTILIILPSWFRFSQCLRRYYDTKQKFPHLANAGKYATSFFVAITNSIRRSTDLNYRNKKISNPYIYLWSITTFIASTYKLIWDLKMDWGFFKKNSGKNKYLREQIVYPSKYLYYIVIIENILFRYIWIINIFIYFQTSTAEYSDIFRFAFGIIELFRRFIWNFFRLENEHLNNCGQFRAVRNISLQMTSTSANFHTAHLDKIAKQTQLEHYRHAKRRHSIQSLIDDEENTEGDRSASFSDDIKHFSTDQTSIKQIQDETNDILNEQY